MPICEICKERIEKDDLNWKEYFELVAVIAGGMAVGYVIVLLLNQFILNMPFC